jgi:hypothetical protein
MDNFYFLYIRVHASGGIAVDFGFWSTNVIGRTLCEMLHRFNGLPMGSAPGMWQDALDTGTEMIVKLPRQDRYEVLDGWHMMLNIYKPSSSAGTGTSLLYDGEQFLTATEVGDSGECVYYCGHCVQKFYYKSFDLPLHLAEFARLDEYDNPEETDEETMEEPKLYISIKTDSLVGQEFWHTNEVGRALCCTTCRLDGVTSEQAEELMLKCTNSSAETVWKLPKCHPYTETCQDGDIHATLCITAGSPTELKYGDRLLVSTRGYPEDGELLDYDNTRCNATTVNIPYILLCAIRDARKEESAPNPGDALLERMNDEVMTEERAESVRRLQEELCPPVPAKTIGEHIPEEPAAVPKYVQMVHHEEPVVHPPVPKKPVEKKQEPATPGEPDGGFAGKLYRAAAMAVVKFGERECTAASGEEIFSMTNSQLMRELMPLVISACDSYLAGSEAGQGAIRIPGQPGWVFLSITDDSVKISLVPVTVEETI